VYYKVDKGFVTQITYILVIIVVRVKLLNEDKICKLNLCA